MKDNKIIWSSSSNSKCPEQFLWLLLVIFMIESGAVIATPDLGSNQLFWRGILNCIMLSPLQINSFQEHKALNKWGENSFFSLSLFRHLNMTMCHGFLGWKKKELGERINRFDWNCPKNWIFSAIFVVK